MEYWNHAQSVKEVAKHLILKSGAASVLDGFRRFRGLKVSHLGEVGSANRFAAIYEKGVWVMDGNQQALSGTGSEAGATEAIRRALPDLVDKHGWKTLVDVGCGDWTWMKTIELNCRYIGLDIVPQVVADNQRLYGGENVEFHVVDTTRTDLPKADVALVREMLFHLSLSDGLKALTNIKRSAKWLVATSDRLWFNSDIRTGDFRMINLERAPYNLPKPDEAIPDDFNAKGRVLGVWRTDQIPDHGWR